MITIIDLKNQNLYYNDSLLFPIEIQIWASNVKSTCLNLLSDLPINKLDFWYIKKQYK